MVDQRFHRPALGSTADLGYLYDARRNDFCSGSIFKSAIPFKEIHIVPSTYSDFKLALSDDYQEKFAKMDVNANLQASFLAGLFSVGGSAHYLRESKQSKRSLRASLICNLATVNEDISEFNENLLPFYSTLAIDSDLATHIVVGIDWGAKSVLSCVYENTEDKSVSDIKGKMQAQLNQIWLSISGKADVNLDDGSFTGGTKFTMEMFGDFIPKELPTTFAAAVQLMKEMPELLTKSSNGKGKPLTYTLLPISVIKKILKNNKPDPALVWLKEASLNRITFLMDDLSKFQQEVNELYQDCRTFDGCVTSAMAAEIADLWTKATEHIMGIKEILQALLPAVQSGKEDILKFDATVDEFYNSEYAPGKWAVKLEKYNDLKKKFQFARVLTGKGAIFLGKQDDFDNIILNEGSNDLYVLRFQNFTKAISTATWKKITRMFVIEAEKVLQLKEDPSAPANKKFYVIDGDVAPTHLRVDEDIKVDVYKNRKDEELPDLVVRSGRPTYQWVASSDSDIIKNGLPADAVLAGADLYGNPVYIGRAKLEKGGPSVGSVVVKSDEVDARFACCDRVTAMPSGEYDILTCPAWAISWVPTDKNKESNYYRLPYTVPVYDTANIVCRLKGGTEIFPGWTTNVPETIEEEYAFNGFVADRNTILKSPCPQILVIKDGEGEEIVSF